MLKGKFTILRLYFITNSEKFSIFESDVHGNFIKIFFEIYEKYNFKFNFLINNLFKNVHHQFTESVK